MTKAEIVAAAMLGATFRYVSDIELYNGMRLSTQDVQDLARRYGRRIVFDHKKCGVVLLYEDELCRVTIDTGD